MAKKVKVAGKMIDEDEVYSHPYQAGVGAYKPNLGFRLVPYNERARSWVKDQSDGEEEYIEGHTDIMGYEWQDSFTDDRYLRDYPFFHLYIEPTNEMPEGGDAELLSYGDDLDIVFNEALKKFNEGVSMIDGFLYYVEVYKDGNPKKSIRFGKKFTEEEVHSRLYEPMYMSYCIQYDGKDNPEEAKHIVKYYIKEFINDLYRDEMIKASY